MIRSFREIKKMVSEWRKKEEIRCDEEGRAVVVLTVRDDSTFLSPYSANERNVISEEVAEFLEHSLKPVRPKERIHIELHSDVISSGELREYNGAIHNYYANCYESTRLETRRLYRISFFMALVAVVALSAMLFLEAFSQNQILIEIIDIFAWVFMWEAVDIFFLQCTLLRYKQMRYLALIDCVLTCVPLTNNVA